MLLKMLFNVDSCTHPV